MADAGELAPAGAGPGAGGAGWDQDHNLVDSLLTESTAEAAGTVFVIAVILLRAGAVLTRHKKLSLGLLTAWMLWFVTG